MMKEALMEKCAELKEESSHSSRSQREYRCQASFLSPFQQKNLDILHIEGFFFFWSILFGLKKIGMVQKNEGHSSRSGQVQGQENLPSDP